MEKFAVLMMMAGFVWGCFVPALLWLVGLGMVIAFVLMVKDEQKKNSKKKAKRG